MKNRENFDLNNIRIDDLIKLNISKPELEHRHVTIDDIQNEFSDISNNNRFYDLNHELDIQLNQI